jgi:hypothetical protein
MLYEERMSEDKLLKKLVDKLKHIFYDKYLLLLKKLDIETFEFDGKCYLLDIKEIQFEKYDSKHIKLACERRFMKYTETHKYKNLTINKNAANLKDIVEFFHTMNNKYEDLKSVENLKDYLTLPPRDKTTDKVFQILRPDGKFTFSQLIDDDVSKKMFIKNTTNNSWNL